MPERIQFKRGQKLPANTVYVGRPSRWGNPFKVGETVERESELGAYLAIDWGTGWLRLNSAKILDRKLAVDSFINWAMETPFIMAALPDLRGKNLACWCPLDGKPCHGDVLLDWANSDGERFRFIKVEPTRNPGDMFFATMEDDGYVTE